MKKRQNDKIFSENLLELTTLTESKIVQDSYCEDIYRAHGSLVQLCNNNVLFDLRSYNYKPLFGHNHPLYIQNELEITSQLNRSPKKINQFSNITPISLLKSQFEFKNNLFYENFFFTTNDSLISNNLSGEFFLNFFFDKKTYIVSNKIFKTNPFKNLQSYLDIVLLKGERLTAIQNMIKMSLINKKVILLGNLIILENNLNFTKSHLIQYNILVNDENFIDNKILLYIPIAITNNQLDYLLSRIVAMLKAT